MHYRSILFVPGNRPERFEKAAAAGADLVCIDLEDAVGLPDKDAARDSALSWLAKTDNTHVGLRINGVETRAGDADVAALKTSSLSLSFIMIPKVANKAELSKLDKSLPAELGVFCPIIESADGLLNAADIMHCERASLALFGAVDFSADVGCDLSWDALLYARSHLAVCATATGTTLFDVPHINVRNLDDCEATTRKARALGIHARAAIHPAQIARIHAAYAPTPEEITHAERLIAAHQKAGGDVALLDGQLIETPLLRKAERVLAYGKNA